MKNKLIILVLMLASTVIILPGTGYAASEKTTSVAVYEFAPQIRVRIGNGRRNRTVIRNRNRGRHLGWRNNQRTRLVKQTYWVNGRRYVRYVRVRG